MLPSSMGLGLVITLCQVFDSLISLTTLPCHKSELSHFPNIVLRVHMRRFFLPNLRDFPTSFFNGWRWALGPQLKTVNKKQHSLHSKILPKWTYSLLWHVIIDQSIRICFWKGIILWWMQSELQWDLTKTFVLFKQQCGKNSNVINGHHNCPHPSPLLVIKNDFGCRLVFVRHLSPPPNWIIYAFMIFCQCIVVKDWGACSDSKDVLRRWGESLQTNAQPFHLLMFQWNVSLWIVSCVNEVWMQTLPEKRVAQEF